MKDLLNDAFHYLEMAIALDEKKDTIEAATKYLEATYLMRRYVQRLPTHSHSQERVLLQEKISHYEMLASGLLEAAEDGPVPANPRSPIARAYLVTNDSLPTAVATPVYPPDPDPRNPSLVHDLAQKTGRANTHLSNALDYHEAKNTKAAIKEYFMAAELYLDAIEVAKRIGDSKLDGSITLLKNRAEGALGELKASPSRSSPAHTVVERGNEKKASLTKEEVSVLMQSSMIASGLFLPFSEQEALALSRESTEQSVSQFIDPDGLLKLSEKQQNRFYKWARPKEIERIQERWSGEPSPGILVKAISPYTIKQKYVTDCSFIASLCICAAFERRFGRKLVTSIVYPQDKSGKPVLSRSGKYMVKLWLNGVARQVVVDDFLPIDRQGNLLCSQTTTRGLELWVSIIEKAYMKLCGGYDFPGSNSGVDLFSLTGWIPERIFFPKNPAAVKDHETPSERAWERLYSASSYGDCLITASSTSDMSEEKATRVGLVTGHAYAVLNVRRTQDGRRLLQMKNPWAHKGWRGRFSPDDFQSWNDKQLCAELGYDAAEARKHDDGVFWICWEDVLVYFGNLHLSWNPALFPHRMTVHGSWPKAKGPSNDSFNVGDNPQYVLTLSPQAISKRASIWILLSRHVTKQEQAGGEVTDFLTAHIHRSQNKSNRIWYPGGAGCVFTGAYTNNPHILIRYDLVDQRDAKLFLVLSQYQKAHDINYTLSCFCTQPFSLGRPTKDLPFRRRLQSEWTSSSAGGHPGQKGFGQNPMWALQVPDGGAAVQLRCSTQKTYAVNVMVVKGGEDDIRRRGLRHEPIIDSGHYRHGYVVADSKRLLAGAYTLVASTFNEGQTGPFFVDVFSSSKVDVKPL